MELNNLKCLGLLFEMLGCFGLVDANSD